MKRFFCCLKGESSSSNQAAQEPHATQNPHELREVPSGFHPQISPELESYGLTFEWEDILNGTEHFLETNLLGQGSFGKVYRCEFSENNAVGAAKIQNQEQPNGYREFVTEVTTLNRANHPNVVTLFGKCFDREHPYTILYEFMPNLSLDRHLLAPTSSSGPILPHEVTSLTWEARMSIALGVAEALVYLHKELRVIHRDVKASNVLLDENFRSKLSGFGLAVSILIETGAEITHVIRPVQGTQGYIAPETEQSGLVSTKSDVYSYGVLLFQLLTGKKAFDEERPIQTRKLIDWLKPARRNVINVHLVVDEGLGYRYPEAGFTTLFMTAMMCIDPEASDRPNMSFVKDMVRGVIGYPVPERPSLTNRASL